MPDLRPAEVILRPHWAMAEEGISWRLVGWAVVVPDGDVHLYPQPERYGPVLRVARGRVEFRWLSPPEVARLTGEE